MFLKKSQYKRLIMDYLMRINKSQKVQKTSNKYMNKLILIMMNRFQKLIVKNKIVKQRRKQKSLNRIKK